MENEFINTIQYTHCDCGCDHEHNYQEENWKKILSVIKFANFVLREAGFEFDDEDVLLGNYDCDSIKLLLYGEEKYKIYLYDIDENEIKSYELFYVEIGDNYKSMSSIYAGEHYPMKNVFGKNMCSYGCCEFIDADDDYEDDDFDEYQERLMELPF